MSEDESEKLFDPLKNPFIRIEEPENKSVDGDPLAPFEELKQSAGGDISPDAISKKLTATFPGANEIEIGSRTFVLMADGSYTEKGSAKKLEELPLADLMMLNDFLSERKK